MKPGTLAFLLRWHFVPFGVGVFLTLYAAYHLVTYVEPAPSSLSAVMSSPLEGVFLPAMWVTLAMGLIIAGRAIAKARGIAGGTKD